MSVNNVDIDPSQAEFDALYHELLKQYYEKNNREKALRVASRLEELLADSPDYACSIRGEEIRSVVAEARDDIPEAIQSREAEIRKILELHTRTVNTPAWDYVSRQYDFGDVGDRLDLLAALYDKHGDVSRSVAVLVESKLYCEAHNLPFDGQELLDELTRAGAAPSAGNQASEVPRDLLDDAIRSAYKEFGEPADEIVVSEPKARRFTSQVNQLIPEDFKTSVENVKRRLLTLRRRGPARGGLPKLKR